MKKSKIKQILEGLKNSVFVKEEVEKIAAERLEICRKCPRNSQNNPPGIRPDEHCMECGCNLHMKTRSLDSSCPLGKWDALASEAEDETIQRAINKPPQSPQDEDK